MPRAGCARPQRSDAGEHPVRKASGLVDEAERCVPVEISGNRGEVGKRRRLREEAAGQPVTGVIGVERVAPEGEPAALVLRTSIFFVLAHEAPVSGDIGGENGRVPAFDPLSAQWFLPEGVAGSSLRC